MENDPSEAVTAKYGLLKTPIQAVIQGWTSHLTRKGGSATASEICFSPGPGKPKL